MPSFYPSQFLSAMVYFALTNSYLKYFSLENYIVITNMSKHKKLQSYTALFRVRTAIINLACCSNKYHKAKCSCSKFQPNIPMSSYSFDIMILSHQRKF